MMSRIVKMGSRYNIDKSKMIRVSIQNESLRITIGSQQLQVLLPRHRIKKMGFVYKIDKCYYYISFFLVSSEFEFYLFYSPVTIFEGIQNIGWRWRRALFLGRHLLVPNLLRRGWLHFGDICRRKQNYHSKFIIFAYQIIFKGPRKNYKKK